MQILMPLVPCHRHIASHACQNLQMKQRCIRSMHYQYQRECVNKCKPYLSVHTCQPNNSDTVTHTSVNEAQQRSSPPSTNKRKWFQKNGCINPIRCFMPTPTWRRPGNIHMGTINMPTITHHVLNLNPFSIILASWLFCVLLPCQPLSV